jgi:hypothetical protein
VFHLLMYQRLFKSLLSRSLAVDDLYIEGFDYGSRGCVAKLRIISKRLSESGASYTSQEKLLAAYSRNLYYIGGLVAVLGFSIFSALFLWGGQ